MAGFYGNIRNSTNNSFKFDRVYSNRFTMDKNANSDGVFGGRYVLVEYDQGFNDGLPVNSHFKTYYQFNDDGKCYLELPEIVASTEDVEIEIEVENPEVEDPETEEQEQEPETITLEIHKYELNPASGDIGSQYSHEDDDWLVQFLNIEIGLSEKDYTRDREYYVKDGIYYDKPYKFDLKNSDEVVLETTATALLYADPEEDPIEMDLGSGSNRFEDNYTINYAIDKYFYSNVGRGYDSTVWRKVYKQDGSATYVNIAELNSVVPTFAVSPDAPSDAAVVPHFDKDSTNVYYNLHLQTPWGFRLAPFEENVVGFDSDFIKIKIKTDEQNEEYQYTPIGDKLSKIDVSKEFENIDKTTYQPKKAVDGDIISEPYIYYYPAIYLNRPGFEKKTHYVKPVEFELSENGINLTSTGKSDFIKYNHDDNNIDTKELSIILPILGDTVSEMWDLMYGNGSDNENRNRNDWIRWEDANDRSPKDKLRLVSEANDETGYYYTPLDYKHKTNPNIDSLAGAINSVHDIMGMIITSESQPVSLDDKMEQYGIYKNPSDTDEFLYNSLPNQIYVETKEDEETGAISHEFYYAGRGYAYQKVNTDIDITQHPEAMWELGTFEGHEENTYDGFEEVTHPLVNYNDINPKQYIRENKYTLKLHDGEVASSGTEYYSLPLKLQYAGILTENAGEFGKTYYVKNGSNYSPEVYPTYIVSSDLVLNEEKTYYVKDEDTGEYSKYRGADVPIGRPLYEVDNTVVYYSIQDFIKVDSTKEPYIPQAKYYTYNRYRDEYQQVQNLTASGWEELANGTSGLFRKDEWANTQKYYVWGSNAGSLYYIRRQKEIQENGQIKVLYDHQSLSKTIQNEHISVDLNNVNNLKKLYELMELVCPEETDQDGYRYDKTNLYMRGAEEISQEEGEPDPDNPSSIPVYESSKYPYNPCRIDAFLFDDGQLYEKNDNNQYTKASFTNNSTNGNIGPATGGDPDPSSGRRLLEPAFYHIVAVPMTPYINYRYVVFKSNDEDIGADGDSFFVKVKSDTNGTKLIDIKKIATDGDGDQGIHEDEAEDVANGIIKTQYQSINKYWLSVNGFDPNATYWTIIDSNGNPVTSLEEIEKYFTIPAAYGANDVNINSDDYEDKTLYYTDGTLYTYDGANYDLAYFGADYVSDDEDEAFKKLYQEKKLYIIDVGAFGDRFKLYQEWNPLIIRSEDDFKYYFEKDYVEVTREEFNEWKLQDDLEITYYKKENDEYVVYEGITKGETAPFPGDLVENPFALYVVNKQPLVLGKKMNISVKRYLPGFARDLNTIHGLILRINEILQMGDLKTRDPQTVQGCLNQMHDIFDKFGELIPGELYGVNRDGKIASIGFEDVNNGESWISLGTKNDPEDPDKKNLYAFHKTIDEFDRDEYSADEDRNTELVGYIEALADDLDTDEKLHDPFGFVSNDELLLKSPVIDNAGHVVGERTTEVMLGDLLLKTSATDGNDNPITTIATLETPDGPIDITTSDTLVEGLQTIVTYVNEGANNIILNDYPLDYPYMVTEDEEPQQGKTYYIKEGNTFIVYNNDPWENGVVVYEKITPTDVDNDDTINEAIAKLQWEINDHKENQLINSGTGDVVISLTSNDGTITATKGYVGSQLLSGYTADNNNTAIITNEDSVNNAFSKLQAQILAVDSKLDTALDDLGDNYARIIRAPLAQVPSSVPNTTYYNAKIKSGWIWIETTNHNIYIKTQEGYQIENFTDEIDRNYWELLNAWQ